MSTEWVLHALEQALMLCQPAPGLNIHADPSSQYTRDAGNLCDNAQAEAGWSTLKTELLPRSTAFASLEEAHLEVAHYLDTYFNRDCRHSALGYRAPHQFEQDLKRTLP